MPYYKLIHDHCGRVSIYFLEDPRGRVLTADEAVYPNGIRPKDGQTLRCNHCARIVRAVEEHLYEVTDPMEIGLVNQLKEIE